MKNVIKNRLFWVISSLVLILFGCSEFKIENPFYQKDGLWEDPFNLTAVYDTDDSSNIILDWSQPTIEGIQNYLIYRSEDSTKFETIVASVPASEINWTDTTTVPNKIYFYAISVVADGRESRKSDATMRIKGIKVAGELTIIQGKADTITSTDTTAFRSDSVSKVTYSLKNSGNANLMILKKAAANSWITITGADSGTVIKPDSVISLDVEINWSLVAKKNEKTPSTITIPTTSGAPGIINLTAFFYEKLSFQLLDGTKDVSSTDTAVFKSTSNTIKTYSLKNSGTGPMTVSSIGTANKWLTVTGLTNGVIIQKDSAVTFTMSVNWDSITVKNQIYNSTLNIVTSSGNKTVPVTVEKIEDAQLDIYHNGVILNTSDTLKYFYSSKQAYTLVCTNSGSTDLNIQNITPSTGWVALTGTTSGTIKPDSSVQFDVDIVWDSLAFSAKPDSANITITTNTGSVAIPVLASKQQNVGIITPIQKLLDFGTTTNTINLELKNSGDAVVSTCRITTTDPWISPKDTTISSIAVNATVICPVRIDRANIPVGQNSGTILLSFSGTSSTVPVKVAGIPILTVLNGTDTVKSAAVDTLKFGSVKEQIAITLENSGTDTLRLTKPVSTDKWLVVDPTWNNADTVVILPEANKQIILTVDTASIIGFGNKYAKITFGSTNANQVDATVTVNRLNPSLPQMTILKGTEELISETKSLIDFADKDSLIVLTIKNSGTGTLHVTKPTFSTNSWLSVDSSSWGPTDVLNITPSTPKEIKLAVDRAKFKLAGKDLFGKDTMTVTFSSPEVASISAKVTMTRIDLTKPVLKVTFVPTPAAAIYDLVAPNKVSVTVKVENSGNGILKVTRPAMSTGGNTWLQTTGWGVLDEMVLTASENRDITFTADPSAVGFNAPCTTIVTFGSTNAANGSVTKTVTFVKPDHTPDKVNLYVESTKHNAVSLRWTKSASPYFTNYRVYRGESADMNYLSGKQVASIDTKTDTTFTDSDALLLSDHGYYYRVYVITDSLFDKGISSDSVKTTTLPARVITGKVTNRNGGAAISGATIVLSQNGTPLDTATSGADGSYQFNNPETGVNDLAVSKTNTTDTCYLADVISLSVPAIGSVSTDTKITVMTLKNQLVSNIPGAITSLGTSNGMLYAYSNTDRFQTDLSIMQIATSNFIKNGGDIQFFSERNNERAFDLIQNGKSFYMPSYFDTTISVDGVTQTAHEGAIAKVNAFGGQSILEVTGVPYAIEETPTATFVLYRRGTDSLGALKAYAKDQTSFTIDDPQLGVLDFESNSITIQDNGLDADYNICRPLMKISGSDLFMTTGFSTQQQIIKVDISDPANLNRTTDWAQYPDGQMVTDMQIVNNQVYVVNNSTKLYVYDLNLKLTTTVNLPHPISRLTHIGGTNSQFGDYLMVLPQFDPSMSDTDRDIYFISPKTNAIAGTLKATANPSSAVQYDDGKIAVATSNGYDFTNFNLLNIVQ